jgi:hypothetical protein
MNTMRKMFSILSVLVLFFIIGCSNSGNENTDNSDSSYDIDSLNNLKESVVKVFYSLPSPIEMASIFKKSGIGYNSEILNPTENVSIYYTNKSLALNLGIYGADLSFSSMFNQQQKTLEYFNAMKKIATKMDIIGAVSDSLLDVIEENINDNEKMMKIVSETFFASDAYLKENNHEDVATLVVVGAWIESLYIAVELAETATGDKEKLFTRIIDQRLSLETLIKLLEAFQSNEDVASLIYDMSILSDAFLKLVIIEKIEVYDKYADTMRIKTITTINSSPELFAELKSTINSIRTSYIN